MARYKLIAACLILAASAVRRTPAPVPLRLRGGADAPPPPPRHRRPPREAVAARLLATGPGRHAVLTGLQAVEVLDIYAPPLACLGRYGWQRLCADVLAPYWVAGADRRDVRRVVQQRAADPRSAEFQMRHRYYGLAPAEADAFLDGPFDKYARVSDAFLRREGLGRYAAAANADADSFFGGKALKAERGSLRRAALRRDAGDDGAAWDEEEEEEEDDADEDGGDADEEEHIEAGDFDADDADADADDDDDEDDEDDEDEDAYDADDEDPEEAEDTDETAEDDGECDHYDDDDEEDLGCVEDYDEDDDDEEEEDEYESDEESDSDDESDDESDDDEEEDEDDDDW